MNLLRRSRSARTIDPDRPEPPETISPLWVRAREPLTHAERGAIGGRKRWGAPRVIRLDGLTPEQRSVVIALVERLRAGTL